MFNNNLIATIKVDGATMNENNGCIQLPFGSEYGIFLKNTSDRKAVIDISIDGKSILGNRSIVVSGNSEITLERSIINNELNSGRKLRFIEKTGSISAHRGDRAEDGFITITYQFESVNCFLNNESIDIRKPIQYPQFGDHIGGIPIFGNSGISERRINTSYNLDGVGSESAHLNFESINTSGITTEGSESNQSFSQINVKNLSAVHHHIEFRLMGIDNSNSAVSKTTTTKTKQVCVNCGKKNKRSHEYCSRCGSYLRKDY